jgi:hypothetical protein
MVAAFAESPVMELDLASPTTDPRHVVTPLDPNRAEELLCRYDLQDTWTHVIVGLREGFDIGIREQLPRSYIF